MVAGPQDRDGDSDQEVLGSRSVPITIAGKDVTGLLGSTSLTGAFLLGLDGAPPSPARERIVDAVLVSIMEHGITPSSLTTRLVLDGAPGTMVGPVAAGLLAIGSRFLGTIEDAARLLQDGVMRAGGDRSHLPEALGEAVATLRLAGSRIPGLGHNLHRLVDPRVDRLLEIAEEEKVSGIHVAALDALPEIAERQSGRHLIVNAAGAIGAILMDLGYQPADAQGFALVARCAGLVIHVADERRTPIARQIWESANANQARGR